MMATMLKEFQNMRQGPFVSAGRAQRQQARQTEARARGLQDHDHAAEAHGHGGPSPGAHALAQERHRQCGHEQGRCEADGDRVRDRQQLERVSEEQHGCDHVKPAQRVLRRPARLEQAHPSGAQRQGHRQRHRQKAPEEQDLRHAIAVGQPFHGGILRRKGGDGRRHQRHALDRGVGQPRGSEGGHAERRSASAFWRSRWTI
jgi:hypothetical protein